MICQDKKRHRDRETNRVTEREIEKIDWKSKSLKGTLLRRVIDTERER